MHPKPSTQGRIRSGKLSAIRRTTDRIGLVFVAAATVSLMLAITAHFGSSGAREFGLHEAAVLTMGVSLVFGLLVAVPHVRRATQEKQMLDERTAELEVEVVTDPLTKLFNRRYFEDALDQYFAEFERIDAPLALLTLDLDHFKSVNDTYGHDAGDVVLRELGQQLRGLTREHDIVARTGGEEFNIIAPFAKAEQIRPFAERICRLVSEMRVDVGVVIIRPTISIGVASTADGVKSPAALAKLSDERLYEAKKSGRNRVVA